MTHKHDWIEGRCTICRAVQCNANVKSGNRCLLPVIDLSIYGSLADATKCGYHCWGEKK